MEYNCLKNGKELQIAKDAESAWIRKAAGLERIPITYI